MVGNSGMGYCEVPLGGTQCVDRQSFPTPYASDDARVLLGPSADEVVLVDSGYSGESANVWVSMDGGQTFDSGPNGSQGVIGGSFSPTGDSTGFDDPTEFNFDAQPVFGPGGFSVSWMDDAGFFENFPDNVGSPVDLGTNLSAGTPGQTEETQLFTSCAQLEPSSIALLDNTTPVAGCVDDHNGLVRYRVATGQGDINDVSTGSWGPQQSVAIAKNSYNAQMVGGPRGVYLLYDAPDENLDVRRLINGTFGPPAQIAPPTYLVGASEDATGNLYAVTSDTGNGAPGRDERVFTSGDGANWTEVPLNLKGVTETSFNAASEISGCAAAAGGSDTGSGWITFNNGFGP
jgi:hypothetical protein